MFRSYEVQHDQFSRVPALETSKIIGHNRKHFLRGNVASSQPITDENSNSQEVVQQEVNNKTRLTKVCEDLGIDAKTLLCPSNGFVIQSLEQDYSAHRTKMIIKTISQSACDQSCPGNTYFKLQMTSSQAGGHVDPRFYKLISKAIELTYVEKNANIAESFLSTSFDKEFLK